MPVRCTFQKGSHIQERKKNSPRNGVIVSTDPAFKGQKHRWLVKFDGEKKPVPRSSNQLLHIKKALAVQKMKIQYAAEMMMISFGHVKMTLMILLTSMQKTVQIVHCKNLTQVMRRRK